MTHPTLQTSITQSPSTPTPTAKALRAGGTRFLHNPRQRSGSSGRGPRSPHPVLACRRYAYHTHLSHLKAKTRLGSASHQAIYYIDQSTTLVTLPNCFTNRLLLLYYISSSPIMYAGLSTLLLSVNINPLPSSVSTTVTSV